MLGGGCHVDALARTPFSSAEDASDNLETALVDDVLDVVAMDCQPERNLSGTIGVCVCVRERERECVYVRVRVGVGVRVRGM